MMLPQIFLVILLLVPAPAHAWFSRNTEAVKVQRIEAKKASSDKSREYERIKVNFRLDSSHNALKEARKAAAWFVLAYPTFAALLYQFDKDLAMSYFSWVPHLVVALGIAWVAEHVLQRQIELNKEK